MKVSPAQKNLQDVISALLKNSPASPAPVLTTVSGERISVCEPVEIGSNYLIVQTTREKHKLVPFSSIGSLVVD